MFVSIGGSAWELPCFYMVANDCDGLMNAEANAGFVWLIPYRLQLDRRCQMSDVLVFLRGLVVTLSKAASTNRRDVHDLACCRLS